jgi:LmbE family N-acetylglucosaminyl deacetylase
LAEMTQRLICVVAHPDDETLFAGGTLAMVAAAGVSVHVLSATRGEGGEVGEPALCAQDALGEVRERELRCAASTLGVFRVAFLGYEDPAIGSDNELYAFETGFEELVAHIADYIVGTAPTILVTHGSAGEYGHPGHILLNRAVQTAHERLRAEEQEGLPALYTFGATIRGEADVGLNRNDDADIVIDVAQWMRAKATAAACHRTQRAMMMRGNPEARTLREVLSTTEMLHRVWPRRGPDPWPLCPFARGGTQWRDDV